MKTICKKYKKIRIQEEKIMEDKKGPEYLGRFLGAIMALLIYFMVTG